MPAQCAPADFKQLTKTEKFPALELKNRLTLIPPSFPPTPPPPPPPLDSHPISPPLVVLPSARVAGTDHTTTARFLQCPLASPVPIDRPFFIACLSPSIPPSISPSLTPPLSLFPLPHSPPSLSLSPSLIQLPLSPYAASLPFLSRPPPPLSI